MNTALVPQDTLSLSQLRDPRASAELICYLGVNWLPKPPPRIGEETDPEYIRRVWPKLRRSLKSQALIIGLQRAAEYREAFSDGIQLVCWRAYVHGWYVPTQEGDGDAESFRLWVRDAVTADGASYTEGHQLASTILNLAWLAARSYPGIPEDPEEIFQSRELYTRWRRVASRLRTLIQSIEDWEEPEDESPGGLEELDEAIQDTIAAVNNPDKGFDDLDEVGKTKSRAPLATIELTGYDDLGRHLFQGAATQTQLNLLRSDTSRHAKWILRGEQDLAGHILVRYRHLSNWACPGCGSMYRESTCTCVACGYEGELVDFHRWSQQTWDQQWSDFEDCEEPVFNGNQEGVPLVDEELGITYIAQWEETNG